MNKVFAENYPQDDKGWYQFPSDVEWRSQVFAPEVMEHPARANLYMLQALIDYVSEPGETIMDIMSGTGSIMIAALPEMDKFTGRRVICLDVEQEYCDLMQKSLDVIDLFGQAECEIPSSMVTIIHGDCKKILPLPVDHIIFSPPYAQIMKSKGTDKLTKEMGAQYDFAQYSKTDGNVGILNEFFYNMAMVKIYELCFESVRSGGTLTIIIKDHIRKGERVYLSHWALRCCIKAGFEQADWFKWHPPGSFYLSFKKARGDPTVEDEDLIVVKKP